MSTGNKLPVVVGVEIPLDESGRYNLNTIHKASGEGDDKSPGQWLRRKTTKELIKELDANLLKNSQDVNLHSAQKSINVVNGGTNPGTFAHELLAVSYAGWTAARGKHLMTVFTMPVSGRWGRQRKQNARQRKSREEGPTRLVPIHALNSLEGKFMKNNIRKRQGIASVERGVKNYE